MNKIDSTSIFVNDPAIHVSALHVIDKISVRGPVGRKLFISLCQFCFFLFFCLTNILFLLNLRLLVCLNKIKRVSLSFSELTSQFKQLLMLYFKLNLVNGQFMGKTAYLLR